MDNDTSQNIQSETSLLDLFIKSLFYCFVLAVAFYMYYKQVFVFPKIWSDTALHLDFVRQYNEGKIYIAHPIFHLSVIYISKITGLTFEYSAVLVMTFFICLIYIIIRSIVGHFLKGSYGEAMMQFITFITMTVSAIYVPFYNKNIYLGQWSPNPWHNPTIIVLKPFALVTFFLFVVLVEDYFGGKTINRRRWRFFLFIFAVLMAVSCFAKPNWVLSFVPAIFIYLFFFRKFHLKLSALAVALLIPTGLALTYQFFKTYKTADGDRIIFDFLGVWRQYSPNIFISILLATAFPVGLLLLRFRETTQNHFLILAWIVFLVALLQYSLLAERVKYKACNFGWGYLMSLHILFLFSIVEFFRWLKYPQKKAPFERLKIFIVANLLNLHFMCGIFYFIKYLVTADYH